MLPSVASNDTYGGSKADLSASVDSTTDRSAAGMNPLVADVAAMTHTAIRAWVRFVPAGTGTPTIATINGGGHDETWNNSQNAIPLVARVSTGIYKATFPVTVFDEVPATQKGATPAGFALNFRNSFANLEVGASTNYDVRSVVLAANVLAVKVFAAGTSTLVDPNDGSTIGLFGL